MAQLTKPIVELATTLTKSNPLQRMALAASASVLRTAKTTAPMTWAKYAAAGAGLQVGMNALQGNDLTSGMMGGAVKGMALGGAFRAYRPMRQAYGFLTKNASSLDSMARQAKLFLGSQGADKLAAAAAYRSAYRPLRAGINENFLRRPLNSFYR